MKPVSAALIPALSLKSHLLSIIESLMQFVHSPSIPVDIDGGLRTHGGAAPVKCVWNDKTLPAAAVGTCGYGFMCQCTCFMCQCKGVCHLSVHTHTHTHAHTPG
jgi:hypothetical protein